MKADFSIRIRIRLFISLAFSFSSFSSFSIILLHLLFLLSLVHFLNAAWKFHLVALVQNFCCGCCSRAFAFKFVWICWCNCYGCCCCCCCRCCRWGPLHGIKRCNTRHKVCLHLWRSWEQGLGIRCKKTFAFLAVAAAAVAAFCHINSRPNGAKKGGWSRRERGRSGGRAGAVGAALSGLQVFAFAALLQSFSTNYFACSAEGLVGAVRDAWCLPLHQVDGRCPKKQKREQKLITARAVYWHLKCCVCHLKAACHKLWIVDSG